jgi:AcrR family transcriptional regulator
MTIADLRHERMMQALLLAFLNHGYSNLTMRGLAQACDLTPRTLYNHFKGKEDVFREVIRWNHVREIRRGWEAGRWALSEGGSAVDVVVAILDARFGEARRILEASPHASELNYEAFRRCKDIINDSAIAFQADLAVVVEDLEKRSLLRLKAGMTSIDAAQFIADGARACNQGLPIQRALTLPERYRAICEALFYGFAEPLTTRPQPAPKQSPREGSGGKIRISRDDEQAFTRS